LSVPVTDVDTELALALAFVERHPQRAAALLEPLAPGDVATALGRAEPAEAAAVVSHLAPLAAAACVAASSPDRATALLEALPVDLSAAILRRAPPMVVDRLLGDLSRARAGAIRRLLAFAEGTAGALADPLAPALAADVTVSDALAWLRAHPDHPSDVLFVVYRDQRLAGLVPLQAQRRLGSGALGHRLDDAACSDAPSRSAARVRRDARRRRRPARHSAR
jgi:Mg/Co/Ni transporter MgtE